MDRNLPDLPIYPHFDGSPNEGRLITLLIAGLFVPIAFAYAFVNTSASFSLQEIGWSLRGFYSLMFISWTILVLYLLKQYRLQSAVVQQEQLEFQTKALTTQAKIVGKYKDEDGEGIGYYIYYQFKPDFIIKVLLKSGRQLALYELAEGTEITIEYIPDEPTKTRIKP